MKHSIVAVALVKTYKTEGINVQKYRGEFLKANEGLQRYAHTRLKKIVEKAEEDGHIVQNSVLYLVSEQQLDDCDRRLRM